MTYILVCHTVWYFVGMTYILYQPMSIDSKAARTLRLVLYEPIKVWWNFKQTCCCKMYKANISN